MRDASRTEVLLRIPVGPGAVQGYRLNAPFDQLVFNGDGRYGVLYHSGQNPSLQTGLYNPNEVAVIAG